MVWTIEAKQRSERVMMLRFHNITSSCFSLTTRNVAFANEHCAHCIWSTFHCLFYQNAAIDSKCLFYCGRRCCRHIFMIQQRICFVCCFLFLSYWFRFVFFLSFDGLDITVRRVAQSNSKWFKFYWFDSLKPYAYRCSLCAKQFYRIDFWWAKEMKVDWNWCLSWRMSIEFLSSYYRP